MKARFLGVAVVLVALAFIVNAMALTSATINGTGFRADIVNTSAALVAITPGASQDSDISITDGTTASISVAHGIQGDSSYSFGHAFGIKNNSSATIYADVTIAGGSGASVSLSPANPCVSAGGGALKNLTIGAGQTCSLSLSVSAGSGATASATPFTITVSADKDSGN